MTFDEAFQREAEALFDAKAVLEWKGLGQGKWLLLDDADIRALAFGDRARASELAAPHGMRLHRPPGLNDPGAGWQVRFRFA